MSNLGMYQTLVSVAKRVGGPERLVAALLAGGYVMGKSTELGSKKLVKVSKAALKKRNKPCATKGQLFDVTADGADSSAGLSLRGGDVFRVLECDADSILIEVLGNPNNPYAVSRQFLMTISAFPADDVSAGK